MKSFQELSGDILGQYTVVKTLTNGKKQFGLPLTDGTNNPILDGLNQVDHTCPTNVVNQEGRDIGCACDKLLQQFHRFDEGIGLDGKWAGGSVTGVCRGWGSTKVSRSLSIDFAVTRNDLTSGFLFSMSLLIPWFQ